jgi:adenine-specific DNA-methyltransferase
MDEVFWIGQLCRRYLLPAAWNDDRQMIQSSAHYLMWYARDKASLKHRKLFDRQVAGIGTGDHYTQLEHRTIGQSRSMTLEERANPATIGSEWRPFQLISLTTGGFRPNTTIDFEFEGRIPSGPEQVLANYQGWTRQARLAWANRKGRSDVEYSYTR